MTMTDEGGVLAAGGPMHDGMRYGLESGLAILSPAGEGYEAPQSPNPGQSYDSDSPVRVRVQAGVVTTKPNPVVLCQDAKPAAV
jgi:hypothetical protein